MSVTVLGSGQQQQQQLEMWFLLSTESNARQSGRSGFDSAHQRRDLRLIGYNGDPACTICPRPRAPPLHHLLLQHIMADIKAAIKRGAFASRRRRSEQQEDVQEPPPPYTPIDRNGSGPSDSHEQPPRVSLRPESSRHAESSRPVESSSQDVRPRVSIPPPAVSPASPPYSPHTQHPFRFSPAGRGHITDLPLGILHRILEYTLHPRITPFAYQSDDGDTAMRAWLLFKLRGVDRRFFLGKFNQGYANDSRNVHSPRSVFTHLQQAHPTGYDL